MRFQRGEVLHQDAVDEDVAAADAAEEETLGRIVEERDIQQGSEIVGAKCEPEGPMIDKKRPSGS